MSQSNSELFSRKLAGLMREKNLSQGDLAALTDVSTATVWGWLNGSIPQRRSAAVLCQKLDVSYEWLVKGVRSRETFLGPKGRLTAAEKQEILTRALGLPVTASDNEIRMAWRQHMMKKLAPMGLPSDASDDEIHEVYMEYRAEKVKEAKAVLEKYATKKTSTKKQKNEPPSHAVKRPWTKMGTRSESLCPTLPVLLFAKDREVASNEIRIAQSPDRLKPRTSSKLLNSIPKSHESPNKGVLRPTSPLFHTFGILRHETSKLPL